MIDLANRPSLTGVALALVLVLLPSVAAARKASPPAPVTDQSDRPTAAMVIAKQLAARSTAGSAKLSGGEAQRIQDRYLSRIGVQLEVRETSQSGRGS